MDSDKIIGEASHKVIDIKPRILFKPSIEILEKMRALKKEKERYPSIQWTYQSMIEEALKQFLDTVDK